ncbi:MAG: hypothetical protein GX605_02235 [Chloroflexi bacterium]|nr:hypothetical protein [Chloroflexota bacterium]
MPWQPIEGSPGMYEKILMWDDETGSHTRLVKGDPGFRSTKQLSHDFWEETYLIEGSCWHQDKLQKPGAYYCRPPHLLHGPFRTDEGYIILEHRYYLNK